MDNEIKLIYDGILDGDMEVVSQNVNTALENGLLPQTILDEGLIAAMDKVGALFEEGEFYVPEMLVAARAMKSGLDILRPKLMEAEIEAKGKVIIGTVKGDLHDIGKNLVAIMLEGAGFDIIDLGVDIPPEKFIEVLESEKPDVVALSALLTTTMVSIEDTISAMKTAGLRDEVKVIVGGAPVTQEYADSIGADGFAADASLAVSLVKGLVN